MIKKTILAAMLASSLGSFAIPSIAAEHGYRNAPPPPRSEAVPQARHGYAWVPGYWQRQDRRYQWVQGTWVRERRDAHYVPTQWVERNGRWYLVKGSWQQHRRGGDRDGDGIRNRDDRDRDGDGIRNREDKRPNDPRRY